MEVNALESSRDRLFVCRNNVSCDLEALMKTTTATHNQEKLKQVCGNNSLRGIGGLKMKCQLRK